MIAEMDTPSAPILYEGPGEGAELMGAEQANFYAPGLEREFGVFINIPTLEYVMGELGIEDTPDNRQKLMEHLGRAIIERKVRASRIDPVTFVGKKALTDDPTILEEVRAKYA